MKLRDFKYGYYRHFLFDIFVAGLLYNMYITNRDESENTSKRRGGRHRHIMREFNNNKTRQRRFLTRLVFVLRATRFRSISAPLQYIPTTIMIYKTYIIYI